MSAELYLREKQLAYDLAYVRAQIKEHAVYKRVDEIDMAISQAKQFLKDSHDWHEKVLAVKDTLGINPYYSENNLEMARAKLRTWYNRPKRALRALNKVKYPTPLPPASEPEPEAEAAKESKGCDVYCEFCCQCPHIPSSPDVYRMSEDTKDKLAAAFGWTGREKEEEVPCVKHHETVARCFCKSCTYEEKDSNYWFEDKTGGQSEMAKNIEDIRGLLHNHTRLEAVKGVGTECYEEKDSNYWFELWAEGMPDIDGEEEEVTKTQQEREEEEEKMEEMRAIWEDRRMIKRL